MTIKREDLGTIDGAPVEGFRLAAGGAEVRLATYGATLTHLRLPGAHGRTADVVLGFDDIAAYPGHLGCFGATCGRYANRIAAGRFTLDGTEHRLSVNEGANHLHGGTRGFHTRIWRADVDEAANAVRFSLSSPDGEEGYPGALEAAVTYRLADGPVLEIDLEAKADRATVVNLVHHGYWNLSGHDAGTVLDHEVEIAAERYIPVGEGKIPTGETRPVAGTPFDFRKSKAIGADHAAVAEFGPGYDHNFCLVGPRGTLRPAVRVFDPVSGRGFALETDEAGVQFYTGNNLDGTQIGKDGCAYPQFAGFCLETQTWPNSPNETSFPSPRLDADETYRHRIRFAFFANAR